MRAAVPDVQAFHGESMIDLLLASVLSLQSSSTDAALALCKPVLARKAQGEIATIAVDSARPNAGGLSLRGRLTAFVGMGTAPAGSASTHHLIRADFTYRCRVRGHRVRGVALNPL
jgi:hypothetical protein